MSRKLKTVTVYTIAEHVGVSPAAVSSVLAGRAEERRIASSTVESIQKAARELGYLPNMAGRRLRNPKGGLRNIELAILTSFQTPLALVEALLAGMKKAAVRKSDSSTRYSISIEMYEAGRLQSHLKLLEPDGYHGVLITNTQPADDAYLAEIALPCASVVIGRKIPGKHCVFETPGLIGSLAARYLIDSQCTAPLVVYGKNLTPITFNRLQIFEQTLLEQSGKAPVKLEAAALTPQAGAEALKGFLDHGGSCDGVFLISDYLGPGVYDVLREKGLQIPDDVQVVGVGDHDPASLYFNPPLVTAFNTIQALSRKAIPLLFKQLEGKARSLEQLAVGKF
jgi:DNA-binding LacI/PurR family transcriptional regulator